MKIKKFDTMTKGVPACSRDWGNTITQSLPKTTAKSCNPAKNWCMTWNNYPEEWEKIVVPVFQKNSSGYIIAKEIGEENGTPHLQVYVESKDKKKIRPMTEFKLPKETRWVSALGTKEDNLAYCKKGHQPKKEWIEHKTYGPNYGKDAEYITWGTCLEKKKYEINIELFKWQEEIVELLKNPPDDRSIYWFWEPDGCAGKTTFQKWLFLNYPNVAVLCGKASDMKNGVVNFNEKNNTFPEIVLINIPRCQDTDHVSWQGIEEIKDMFFFSGKYEGGMVCGPNPHVFIFSNQEPPEYKLSSDRWIIVRI